MLKNKLLPIILLALSQPAFAAEPPSSGTQIQQIPKIPVPPKAAPELRIEQKAAPALPTSDQVKIVVNSLHVTGNSAYPEAELVKIAGLKPGSQLTLTELRALAAKIADHYHKNGYFVAQAFLPAQEIKDGIVTIAVFEGKYGKVSLNNPTNLDNDLANALLEGLNSGDTIATAPLENRLLLLSDIPGVTVKSTLVPGASVGASDLIVDVQPGQRVTGNLYYDNQGNRYTGANRYGATVNLNNPFGHGDVASLQGLSSFDGLDYGRASYQTQIGKAKAGVAYTGMDYRLGKDFKNLNASGFAQIASLFGSYPLIRTRNNNLNAQLGFDAKTFRDKVDLTATVQNKQVWVGMASLAGDYRDRFLGGGLSSYSLTWTSGDIDLQSPDALAVNLATARSNGHYDKFGLNAMRLQNITETVSLFAAIKGQAATKNLDTSEKMELGGANNVRAYPEGEAYGDQGYVLNVEARWLMPRLPKPVPGQVQLVGFIDHGMVELNKNTWSLGQNTRNLSGGGVGVNWVDNGNFSVKGFYAHKIGTDPATSAPDQAGRFWVQAVKYF